MEQTPEDVARAIVAHSLREECAIQPLIAAALSTERSLRERAERERDEARGKARQVLVPFVEAYDDYEMMSDYTRLKNNLTYRDVCAGRDYLRFSPTQGG